MKRNIAWLNNGFASWDIFKIAAETLGQPSSDVSLGSVFQALCPLPVAGEWTGGLPGRDDSHLRTNSAWARKYEAE